METLIESFGVRARSRVVSEIHFKDKTFPLYVTVLGSADPFAPSLGLFAGAHGLEKIGSEVVLSYMRTVLELLEWDSSFRERLKTTRLVFMPLLNPVGIMWRTRSNGNGVDLIRNSPLDAVDTGGPIYRGHRISNQLPWFRGVLGEPLEQEIQALFEVVEQELLTSKVSLAVDVHSGFGAADRFWFPYSHSRQPFPNLSETFALKTLLDRTYSNHFYAYEPMSRQYTIHGDPWDHLYEENRRRHGHGLFIPFTLEMGSWTWLRKNPLQILRKAGVFDPVMPHRRRRILRRHLNLFDFLHRALLSPEVWMEQTQEQRARNRKLAMELWYDGR
ncbi:MAG TPA: DUF2817 domain-containing protein [Bdellovibrionales bacterium]|nr:DUF2817 domain-containing protein [Bdellovibrionales bacterium]